MCGIVGYLGNQEAWPVILEGLQRLEYRGYDSAGIAIADSSGHLHFRKTVGKVVGLIPEGPSKPPHGFAGIGHTRWATHGKPSRANAHPQTECVEDIALVHNGIVENFLELKRRLQSEGHHFTSETDTEVIAHLMEEGCGEGLSFENSFRRLGRMLKGSHAIAAMYRRETGKIYVMRLGNAGGIVLANRDGQSIVASELPALLPLFPMDSPSGDVGFLEPGEMAVVTLNGIEYLDLAGNVIEKQLRLVTPEDVLIDKGGYQHFMLKEIMEQPQAVAAAIRERVDFELGRVQLPDFPISDADINQLQRVMLIGCGTSLHAAQVGRYLIERLAGLPAEVECASEFRYRNAYINDRTLYISITQSGETADTVAAMHEIKANAGRLITICNAPGSQTSRVAEGTLYMRSGIEVGVASTKTFIASLTILNILAVYLGQVRGQIDPAYSRRLVDDLARCPTLIGDILADTSQYQLLAERYSGYSSFVFLGRGINSPIASEGALKLKEISYIHAEAYPAGEMKHGPIALIDEQVCTLALAPRDALFDKMLSNVKEVKARNGAVIGVATDGDTELIEEVDEIVYIPRAPEHLVPMLATIPLQLLAYYTAVLRGCDIDQPRNLAKSVTVE